MSAVLQPASVEELAAAVRSAPRVIATGAGSKPRLSTVCADAVRVSTSRLSGITEYEPSEFTFTALAGTPVREIRAALGERGQYLPFDPVLADAGSTLAGAVAAGINGPGRWRYGGLRDFILGVRLVDGEGRLLRFGGKVVKNAAGFDVPKLLVGSAGRLGVIAEMTFKVFPRPLAWRSLRLPAVDEIAKGRLLAELGRGRWELDAVESVVGDPVVFVRLGAPEAAIDALAKEIMDRFGGEILGEKEAAAWWFDAAEFRWTHPAGAWAKFPLTPSDGPAFATWVATHPGARARIGAAGNVGYVSWPVMEAAAECPWRGVLLRGNGPLWPGPRRLTAVAAAVKAALDPVGRFPGLED
jgi:glycolate oxidase FAD binding subunit